MQRPSFKHPYPQIAVGTFFLRLLPLMRAFKLQLRVRNITYVDRSWVQCIRKYIDIGYWHICHHAYIEQCIFVLQNQMRVVSIVLIFVMSSERKGRGLPALSMLQAGFNFPSSHRQVLGALQRPLPHRPSSHRAVIKSRISQVKQRLWEQNRKFGFYLRRRHIFPVCDKAHPGQQNDDPLSRQTFGPVKLSNK